MDALGSPEQYRPDESTVMPLINVLDLRFCAKCKEIIHEGCIIICHDEQRSVDYYHADCLPEDLA